MQKRDNPYTPGAGRKPPLLAGRDRDLENFQSLIERLAAGGYERSLSTAGLRGVGKTVLLMELDVLASEAGWATTDVQEVGSQPDFRVTFARMAVEAAARDEPSPPGQGAESTERWAWSRRSAWPCPPACSSSSTCEAAPGIADSGDPEQDLTDLMREIGEVAQATGAGALFLIDEMHNLDASVAGCDLHRLPGDQPQRAARRDGRRRPPRPAGPADVRQALRRPPVPVPRARAPVRRRGARRADRAGGHPRRRVTRSTPPARSCASPPATRTSSRNTASSCGTTPSSPPITSADVEAVREIVTDSLARNFFGTRFQLATDAEQRYLAAMASSATRPTAQRRSPAPTAPRTSAASRSTATR